MVPYLRTFESADYQVPFLLSFDKLDTEAIRLIFPLKNLRLCDISLLNEITSVDQGFWLTLCVADVYKGLSVISRDIISKERWTILDTHESISFEVVVY